MSLIYLDNAATTHTHPEVIKEMNSILCDFYGNPSSLHSVGRSAKAKLEHARKKICEYFSVSTQEIIFTSCGTEADNMIIDGAFNHLGIKHFITSPIEHHAVLGPLKNLKRKGYIRLDFLKINEYGLPDFVDLKRLLSSSDEMKMVSLMHVNNELGTIIDLYKVGELCKSHNALFHSDTVQSVGHFKLNFDKLPVDFAVASAHKFHGPKGIGFIYACKKNKLGSFIYGGEQERGMRAGTEAVHNIVGMERALEIAHKNLKKDVEYLKNLKSYCLKKINEEFPNVIYNGLSDNLSASSHTILSVRIPMSISKAKLLSMHMDLKGVCCSRGSACQSGSESGSHVINEILTEEQNQIPSIRLSFSTHNTMKEIDKLVDILREYIDS